MLSFFGLAVIALAVLLVIGGIAGLIVFLVLRSEKRGE
mgnify:CR=1 FL=1